MKPLLLEMQAFGPFGGRQRIDFGRLGERSFFLIHGPTGSGKTSILDAICFALFGDSSGGEREGRQMRSQHARAEVLTEVSFEFRLGAERYRVRRVPEQMRPARRGGGETRQAPQAALWRIGGDDKEIPLASKWSEVGARVGELLGFESRQFRQVIMLPQGRFRDFLVSRSSEREQILQSLFGTEIYKRVEEALKKSAAELERESAVMRTRRATLLEQAAADGEQALVARLAEQQAALQARRAEELAAAEAVRRGDDALGRAQQVEASFVESDAAGKALQALRDELPAWSGRRQSLAGARRAARVRPEAEAAERLGGELAEAADELARLQQAGEAARQARDEAQRQLLAERQRAPEIEACLRRQAELQALAERVGALAEARRRLDQACAALAAEEGRSQVAGQAATQARTALEGLQQEQRQAQLRAAALVGQRAELARLDGLIEAAAALAALARDEAGAAEAIERGRRALQQCRAGLEQACERLAALKADWIAGLAGRLAHTLADGQPCPVCGAGEHPAPAHDARGVSDEALQTAEADAGRRQEALREAEKALQQAEHQAALLAQRAADLRARLGEAAATPAAALAEARRQAAAALAEGEAADKRLATLDTALAEATRMLAEAEAALADGQGRLAALREQASTLAGQAQERAGGIPPELAEPAALGQAQQREQARLAGLRQALEVADRQAAARREAFAQADASLAAARRQHEQLAGRREQAAQALQAKLAQAGLADLAAYRAALLDDEAVAELDESIQHFDAALKSATERSERAARALAGQTRPELAALQAEQARLREAHLAAGKAAQQAASALEASRKLHDALSRLNAEFAELEARYTVQKQVAEVVGGHNPLRMSLQRYVLATLLEEVLVATTKRLQVMSRGRYEMRRRLEAADQRSAAGLDLEVFDHYTGQSREVGTLSGGESFLASLALALGLSDVVQSYAGGIRLDAIFVDEGFGTLDPEALDHAIRALKDLQQAGRMVGIISHVAELKEWIDVRLELKTTQAGSVAAFVG